jgi:two-component system sensor histidine kinase KdpD
LEPQKSVSRGRLKVFIGAVPGVGKTFKMLSEAQRRYSRGEDIVVGFVETHGRPATAAMTEGLEQIPLKRIEYRGMVFDELDTAAVIARHPEWVLIDELAHTNAPGTIHAKRWQSVEEIRDAGINVISTMNVQHLESMNDIVFNLTGVRVRETLPDNLIDCADEVELVDLTPDALINRLKRGDIYRVEKIPQALSNFFRKGNIVALRELALRKTAEEVDCQIQGHIESHHVADVSQAQEDVLVCITPRPLASKLIRRGYRLANRLQAGLITIYVGVPGALLSAGETTYLMDAMELCRNMGGKTVELQGESPAEEIINYANSNNVAFIVMGKAALTRLQEVVRGSLLNKIMRGTRNVDIVVIGESDDDRHDNF